MSDCKTCSKCREVKAVAEFYLGAGNRCKECSKKQSIAWRNANPKKRAATEAAYQKRNPEKLAARNAAYHKENPEKVAANQKAYRKRNPGVAAKLNAAVCLELRQAYVANCIGLPSAHITPELLDLKRQQLEAHRLSKQIAKALNAKGEPA